MKTARPKYTEEALHELIAFNQKLLDTSPDIIYVYDIIDRKNIYSNQGITKILGYSIEEIQAMGENFLPELMHPDDFNVYLKEIITRYQSAKDEENIEHEYRMKHVDGSWRWLHSKESIFTRLDNGKPKQIFGLTSDVTENKQAYKRLKTSEEKYRELYNNMSNGVCIYEAVKGGKDFVFKDINKAGEEIANITREAILGKSIYEVRPNIEEFGLVDVFRRVFKTGKSEIHSERFYEDKNLTGYFVNFVYKLESGEIIAIFENITGRKQAEEELIHSNDLMRFIIEHNRSAIAVHDRDLKYLFVS
jgi:PAS domain S-box-containing protein